MKSDKKYIKETTRREVINWVEMCKDDWMIQFQPDKKLIKTAKKEFKRILRFLKGKK